MPNTASIRARQIKTPCNITKIKFASLPSTIGVPSGGRYNQYAPECLAGVGGGIQRQIAIRVGKCPTYIAPTPTPSSPTILVYNITQGSSFLWNGVTFTLDPSLPNYSYTANITSIPAVQVPSYANLIGVTIGNTVTSIGINAFYDCTALTSVIFTPTSTLGSIGIRAFQSCSSLTLITIPTSVTSIGANAFLFSGLITVTIANLQLAGITSPTANPPGVAFFGVTVATV